MIGRDIAAAAGCASIAVGALMLADPGSRATALVGWAFLIGGVSGALGAVISAIWKG